MERGFTWNKRIPSEKGGVLSRIIEYNGFEYKIIKVC